MAQAEVVQAAGTGPAEAAVARAAWGHGVQEAPGSHDASPVTPEEPVPSPQAAAEVPVVEAVGPEASVVEPPVTVEGAEIPTAEEAVAAGAEPAGEPQDPAGSAQADPAEGEPLAESGVPRDPHAAAPQEGQAADPAASEDARSPEPLTPETQTPETLAPEAAAPEADAEAPTLEAEAPEALAPGNLVPEAVAPEADPPAPGVEALPHEAFAPEAAPEALAPEAQPEVFAPETSAPGVPAPEAVAPEALVPEAVPEAGATPEALAPESFAPAPEDAPEAVHAPEDVRESEPVPETAPEAAPVVTQQHSAPDEADAGQPVVAPEAARIPAGADEEARAPEDTAPGTVASPGEQALAAAATGAPSTPEVAGPTAPASPAPETGPAQPAGDAPAVTGDALADGTGVPVPQSVEQQEGQPPGETQVTPDQPAAHDGRGPEVPADRTVPAGAPQDDPALTDVTHRTAAGPTAAALATATPAETAPDTVAQEPHPGRPVGPSVPAEDTAPATPAGAPAAADAPPEQPAAPVVPAPREAEQPQQTGAGPVRHADEPGTRAAGHEDQETAAVAETDARAQERTEPGAPAEGTPDVADVRQPTGPAAPGYDDAEREAVLKVMRERRDIRNGFRSDPIPHEVLLRVLEAAHTAPSVGHSQPWDFVVIRSADTRRAMHELATRQRDAYASSLPKGRAKQFKELKIEAILDTPVNIVVTADPTRGGRHTLGRHTQPQMAPYSSALAVENLWLAARAEGLGVGWVSFFDEREMVRALGLPDHLEVVAYLCVGYVDEFPAEPELMQAGWSKRRPLSWVVHEETYGRRALPGEEPHDLLAETVAQIRPLDAKALGEAWERQKRMTKPAGALGMLEIISAQLCGLSRQCPPPVPEPAAVAIFAGDHGVHAQGVTPWPQEVTAQMVANFLGGGAVCNAFASQVGAEVCVVDVGVAADLPATPGLLPRKIRAGTSDMTAGPALTREEVKQALEVGIETARDLVAAGNKALLTGEMGIANTTASAALISVFTGADPAEVTGRGTGINDETLARKTEVVRRALELHRPDPADPIGVLAAIGGLEHAAMVGLLLGGASLRTPVILDGVSAGAAALVARAIAPEVLAACIAGHRSAEPGHVAALNKLGLRPLVDLDLRLGEGTGALLALPLVQSTARAMHEVATFDSAGVTEK
ncbi:MAG TPA: nicotinate-nucleotide--dimethylbenzimidazole phosphoribosyltransferase [Streptomyces sp.]|nr:nicotinate-nucleotide--dimethylbenzimidazole phosphoribosyltransferase [Streptomyces sp.]